jgi:hypothetical protein
MSLLMSLNRTILALLLFALAGLPNSFAQNQVPESTITGKVLGPAGRPLADVQVTGCHHNAGGGYETRSARTDAEGQFRIDEVGPVTFFRVQGYKPEIRISESSRPMEVVLQDGIESERPVDKCGPLKRGYRSFGSSLRIAVPRSARIKRTVGDDTWEDQISIGENPGAQLMVWEGPGNYNPAPILYSRFPNEDWILNSSTYSERTIVNQGNIVGIDTSGVTKAGKRWRWVEVQLGVIYYQNATDGAAEILDQILSSACVNTNN